MSGGSGYVLSRNSLNLFVTKSLSDPRKCRQDEGGYEDQEMGICLENVGVKAGDSRDAEGRNRFLPLNPLYHILKPNQSKDLIDFNHNDIGWYNKYAYYSTKN